MSVHFKPINSREKGAGGEREFARLVLEHLGVALVRNLEQSRQGGHDLIAPGSDPVSLALNRYAIEVKRYREITPALLAEFWRQAERQAHHAAKFPALAYRQDRQEWAVTVPLHSLNREAFQPEWTGLEWAATLSVPAFCCLIREQAGENSGVSTP